MKPNRTASPPALNVLGVMTGTSCDGLDAACLRIDGESWEVAWTATQPYPQALRKRVLAFQDPEHKASALEMVRLDRDLGEWFGETLKILISAARPRPQLIANHGQTVLHRPAEGRAGVTLQLGDPARIARLTGCSVVTRFRSGDMAAGGQGAPLAPLFHKLLAGRSKEAAQGLAIHNLGGISNLTYLGPKDLVVAFDTGPGNIWIDAAATLATRGRAKMDKDGKLGMRGAIDIPAVARMLRHPYFSRDWPKSTGRDDFPFELLLSGTKARGNDLVATATAVTVESIARAYDRWIVKKKLPLSWILLAGGGARNPLLTGWLTDRMPGVRIAPIEETGLDASFLEAEAFAVFGYLSLLGRPLGGSWTGAKGFGPPGALTPGENWRDLLSLATKLSAAR